MGFCMTEPLQERRDPPAKNRVVGSRHFTANRVEQNDPQPLETVSETSVTFTITVTGLSCWLSRDPLGEELILERHFDRAGAAKRRELMAQALKSSYAYVGGNPVGRWDFLGLAMTTVGCTQTQKSAMETKYNAICGEARKERAECCWGKWGETYKKLKKVCKEPMIVNCLQEGDAKCAPLQNQQGQLMQRCGFYCLLDFGLGNIIDSFCTLHLGEIFICPAASTAACGGDLACTLLHEMVHKGQNFAGQGAEQMPIVFEKCWDKKCESGGGLK